MIKQSAEQCDCQYGISRALCPFPLLTSHSTLQCPPFLWHLQSLVFFLLSTEPLSLQCYKTISSVESKTSLSLIYTIIHSKNWVVKHDNCLETIDTQSLHCTEINQLEQSTEKSSSSSWSRSSAMLKSVEIPWKSIPAWGKLVFFAHKYKQQIYNNAERCGWVKVSTVSVKSLCLKKKTIKK